ncbi:hypothetical protein B0J14DRAFT_610369 [Halenospora varia]|nr:hypothetical protein B0J14DRAFT_610369 [Halenospora varia]
MIQFFRVACRWYVFGCVTFGVPWLFLTSSLAAVLAALSAASFPQIPVWAGIHLISICVPRSLCSLSISDIASAMI